MAGLLEADYDGYRELYRSFRDADKTIQRAFRKRLAEAGKPLAEAVIADAPDVLPSRGGLAAKLRTARPKLTLTQTRLAIALAGPRGSTSGKGADLNAINRGRLRHPVYGRRVWVSQSVKAGAYSDAWEDHADEAVEAVAAVLDDIIRDLT